MTAGATDVSGTVVQPTAAMPVVPGMRARRSALFWLSAAWLTFVILVALLANLLPLAPYAMPVGFPRATPAASVDGVLGLDGLGRSVVSRLAYGGRVSLLVATVAGVTAMCVGTLLGLLAGYFRGTTETVIMFLTDAMLAFPPLVFLLALSAILQPSYKTLLIGLTTLMIPSFVRLSRANTLNWSTREFVLAATNMGGGRLRVAFREVLPNVAPAVLAYFPTIVASLIIAEGSLSFIGLGIPPPTPSWGGMISDGKNYLQIAPHLVLIPAVVVFLTVFALNQCGDYARARFDHTTED